MKSPTFLNSIIFSVCVCLSGLSFASPILKSNITGITGPAQANAEKKVKLLLGMHKKIASDIEIKRLYHQIDDEIIHSIRPYGYFKATIQSSLTWSNNQWIANFQVSPGPRIKINHVRVNILGDGRTDREYQAILNNFPLKTGQYLETPSYSKAKDSLLDIAASRGYFDAKMQASEITVDLESYKADITILLNTGQRYRFGEVRFIQKETGAKRLSFRFLSRFVEFKQGEFFDQQALFDLQKQLRNSNYFDQVTVNPEPRNSVNGRVPIAVTLIASKSKHYQFGAGIGTDSGIRGLAGVKFRRITQDGHYAESTTKGSYKDGNITGVFKASYNIPGHNPNKDLYKFFAQAEQDNDKDYGESTSGKLGASYITEISGWQQTTGIVYQVERSNPEGENPFSSDLLIPTLSWLRIKSDDPIRPNSGYKIMLSFRGATKKLLSNTDFFQAKLTVKWLHTFGESFRLIARGDLGQLAIDNIDTLPLSLRFTAGGAQSIRGYGFRNIKDGRAMSIVSLEAQQRIYKEFYFSAFADAGDIGSKYFDDIKRSLGVGVVWRSPVGSVSLTVAQAIDKPGQPRRVELSMGPEL